MPGTQDPTTQEKMDTTLRFKHYTVHADHETTNTLPPQFWMTGISSVTSVLVCAYKDRMDEIFRYGEAFGELLQAETVGYLLLRRRDALREIIEAGEEQDHELIIVGTSDESFGKHMVRGFQHKKLLRRLPKSILLAIEPRWPINQILLVLHGQDRDHVALDWGIRLSHASGAVITLLMIAPMVPAMYLGLDQMRTDLRDLLSRDCAMGRHLRLAAERLNRCDVEGSLHLRQGPPEWQIREEVFGSDHDLIITAAETSGEVRGGLQGSDFDPNQYWVDRPVLVVKPLNM